MCSNISWIRAHFIKHEIQINLEINGKEIALSYWPAPSSTLATATRQKWFAFVFLFILIISWERLSMATMLQRFRIFTNSATSRHFIVNSTSVCCQNVSIKWFYFINLKMNPRFLREIAFTGATGSCFDVGRLTVYKQRYFGWFWGQGTSQTQREDQQGYEGLPGESQRSRSVLLLARDSI